MPAYSTVDPALCAGTALLAGPPAPSDRTIALVPPHTPLMPDPKSALIALDPGQPDPLCADPRHTLHVPITASLARAGSSIQGGATSEASFDTCAYPIVGVPAKSAAPHALPFPQYFMLTPASVETYQFLEFVWSMATGPPSPAATCAHADPLEIG